MPIIDATETVGFRDGETAICVACMKKDFYQNVSFFAPASLVFLPFSKILKIRDDFSRI